MAETEDEGGQQQAYHTRLYVEHRLPDYCILLQQQRQPTTALS
jgi:hypothetical protein